MRLQRAPLHPRRRGSDFLIVLALIIGGGLMLVLLRVVNSGSQASLATQARPTNTPISGIATAVPTSLATVAVPPTETTLSVGQVAPDFNLMGLDGKPHRLKDYRGKQVILNFWASWCAPCRVETPLLQATYKRLVDRGVVVIGVNMREDATTARRFVDEFSVIYPILLDPDAYVAITYEVFGLPTTFFVDPDGVIQAKEIGMLTQESVSKNLSLMATPNPK